MKTKILFCKCPHAYQDARYGEGKRVHNMLKPKPDMPPVFRCSVCENKRGE